LIHPHTLQSLLPDEDLGNEIAQISKRARRLVTAHSTKAVAQDPAPLPATEIVLAERHPNSRPSAPSINTNGKQHIRYTHARDGTRIAYSVTGSGPAIVRVSHWMSHLEFDWESPVWGHWIEALSNGFTLVRYDGRLNGLSDTI